MFSRRRVLAGALAALAGPVLVGAQAADKIPRLGLLFVGARSDPEVKRVIDAFVQGLREAGLRTVRSISSTGGQPATASASVTLPPIWSAATWTSS